MKILKCQVCGFEIKPEDFENLKANWKCQCGADKKKFKKIEDPLDEAVDILHKYREGTPPGEVEVD
ncbi:MAG: hypothetical protein V1839_04040 [archaeon]